MAQEVKIEKTPALLNFNLYKQFTKLLIVQIHLSGELRIFFDFTRPFSCVKKVIFFPNMEPLALCISSSIRDTKNLEVRRR